MPKAILKDGVICPLEPLPTDWADGRELSVELALDDDEGRDLEEWFKELVSLTAQNDPRDFARVALAIQDAREQAKALVRKQMGTP